MHRGHTIPFKFVKIKVRVLDRKLTTGNNRVGDLFLKKIKKKKKKKKKSIIHEKEKKKEKSEGEGQIAEIPFDPRKGGASSFFCDRGVTGFGDWDADIMNGLVEVQCGEILQGRSWANE